MITITRVDGSAPAGCNSKAACIAWAACFVPSDMKQIRLIRGVPLFQANLTSPQASIPAETAQRVAVSVQVIVKAQAKVNECKASAEVRVATGVEGDLNKVECVVNSAASSDQVVQDACKHAAEDLALSVCDLEDRTADVLHVQAEVRNALLGLFPICFLVDMFPRRPHSYCIPWQDPPILLAACTIQIRALHCDSNYETRPSSGAACTMVHLVHRGHLPRMPVSVCRWSICLVLGQHPFAEIGYGTSRL